MPVSPGESLACVARGYELGFLHEGRIAMHHAFLGIAHVENGVPLFYDGMNEHGLCCAALRFADSCKYSEKRNGRICLASFEVIVYALSRFSSVGEAMAGLAGLLITDECFSDTLPPSPLHWILSDSRESAVIEPTRRGVSILKAPHGVMTNAPEMSVQNAIYESGALFDALDNTSSARYVKAARIAKTCDPVSSLEMLFLMRALSVPRGLSSAGVRSGDRTVYISVADPMAREYTVVHEESGVPRKVMLTDGMMSSGELSVWGIGTDRLI